MEAAKEKALLETILEQIKIIVVIYGIVIVVHMVSMGTPLPGLLKSTVVSFIMVAIAIVLKNVVKKPNLPGFAWATLVAFVLTLPISPLSDTIVELMSAYSFGLVGIPLLQLRGNCGRRAAGGIQEAELEDCNYFFRSYGVYLFWFRSNFQYYSGCKGTDLI